MKTLLAFIILLFSFGNLVAQSRTDTIEVKKGFGVVFKQNGQKLTPAMLVDITKSNAEASNEMKIAKSNYNVAYVFSFAGGALVGWPIGAAIGGGEPNWTLAGVGAGLIVVSIPFSSAFTKHATKAVRIYNNDLTKTGMNQVEFRFGMVGNGVGVNLSF